MIVKDTDAVGIPAEYQKAHEVVDSTTLRGPAADEPPSYDETRAGPSMQMPTPQWGPSSSAPTSPAAAPATHHIFRPAFPQTVNMISLFSKHNALSGTYLIDPTLPAPPLSMGLSERCSRKVQRRGRSIDREHARNAARAFGSDSDPDTSDSGFLRRGAVPAVNAAFRTRHGRITVDLGIVVNPAEIAATSGKQRSQRARVMLSSRHGAITVDLKELQSQRSVDLDVSTRHGSITILLPPTFDGAIAIRRRGGSSNVNLLPGFAERARTVRAHDREMNVILSPNVSPQYPGQHGEDRCIVSTRHGRITFGISGVDRIDLTGQVGGLFKLIGDFVRKM